MLNLCARGVRPEEVTALPVSRRPNGAWNKSATAVRTNVVEYVSDTSGTKRTFIRADASVDSIGR
jgi:hypothetical protein